MLHRFNYFILAAVVSHSRIWRCGCAGVEYGAPEPNSRNGPSGIWCLALEKTLSDYRRAVELGEESVALDAGVGGNGTPHKALTDGDGPFWALEVQPSITFTYGGTRIDTSAWALSDDGLAIPGLYVAGMDAGGFSNWRYCGGLALAFELVDGRRRRSSGSSSG